MSLMPALRASSITLREQARRRRLVGDDDDGVLGPLDVQPLDRRAHLAQVDLAAVHPDLAVRADRDQDVAGLAVRGGARARRVDRDAGLACTNDVVMMKKISRFRTKSSIGARSMPCVFAGLARVGVSALLRYSRALRRRRCRRRPDAPGRSPGRAARVGASVVGDDQHAPSGFCACSRSTLARTARTSTTRSSTRPRRSARIWIAMTSCPHSAAAAPPPSAAARSARTP